MTTFPIVEIFKSIQGEGCNLGKPANFIRFAGCNLNCEWCDTKWDKPLMGQMTVVDIISKLDAASDLVVLTGGEPLIQNNLNELIGTLTVLGYDIAIETNGTKATKHLKELYPRLWIACSPKPETGWLIAGGCVYDELKYVIDSDICEDNIALTGKPVWLQPEGSHMAESWRKAYKIAETLINGLGRRDIRIGVQLHKIMEVR